MNYHTLLFCDLDGTLISRYQPLSQENATMISRLRQAGTGVIAASGRSPSLLREVLAPDLQIAAAICSTGTGIIDWETHEFLLKRELNERQIRRAVRCLCDHHCNFMLQNPLPENHLGQYFIGCPDSGNRNDFFLRLQRTPDAFTELQTERLPAGGAQLLAVFSREELPLIEQIRKELEKDFSLVRATSPLDQKSIWLEIFAPGVNKASAAQWLKQTVAPKARCLALGNDYNDCDLLNWADDARLAENAPEELKQQFGFLKSPPEHLLKEAADLWELI